MKSIHRLVTRNLIAGFGLLLLVTGAAIYLLAKSALSSEFDKSLETRAVALVSQIEQSSKGIHIELSPQMQAEFADASRPEYFEVWNADGTVAFGSANLGKNELRRRAVLVERPRYWNLRLDEDVRLRAVGFLFTPKAEDEDRGQPPAAGSAIVVACDRRPLDRTLAILATVLVAAGIVALCVTVPLVHYSLRRGLAPLDDLSRETARISSDSLDIRYSVESLPDELRPISRKLNELLARLESSFHRERQFSADLAHELRTPIAELRAQAEVWVQQNDGENLEAHRETLAIALQMQRLVEQLLELSRYQNGTRTVSTEQVNLAELVAECWRPHSRLALDRKVSATFDIPTGVAVTGNRALLSSILNNLFSNAAAYAPKGGQIKVSRTEGQGAIQVANTIENLTRDDLPHLFERLWRKEASRTDHDHSGLGLALAQSFAEAMNWELKASMTADSWLVMTLAPVSGGPVAAP